MFKKVKFSLFLFAVLNTATAQPPTHSTWNKIWADEFNGKNSDLDTEWLSDNFGYASNAISCSRWRKNAVEGNGVLRLNFIKEPTSGPGWSYEWTAANVYTKRKFKYGYFECRYKVAAATGLNNSFWLITSGTNVDTTIKRFEIDINEAHYSTSSTSTKQINTNTHNWSDRWKKPDGTETHAFAQFATNPNPWYNIATNYHIMGLEWNEKELIWYLDGKIIRRSANVKAWGAPTNCFDDAPIYLSGATGKGSIFGGLVTDAANGTFMEIDWVRVYEKSQSITQKTTCVAETTTLTVNADIPDVTKFQWEVSTFDNGTYGNWLSLSNGANYSGVSSNVLTLKNISNNLAKARFRCFLVTDSSANAKAYPKNFARYSSPITLSLNPRLTVTANTNTPNFLNSTVRFTANTTGGTSDYTYNWSGVAGFTSTEANPFIPNFSATNNGLYSVIVTDKNGCTNSATVTVDAIASTNAAIAVTISTPTKATVLSNLLLNATASGGSGIYSTYLWAGPNGFSSTLQSPTIANLSTANSGVYTVFITDNAGFTSSKSINIGVEKANQTLNFESIANQSYTAAESAPIELNAMASSNLAVKYKSSNTILASIVGNKLIASRKRYDYSIELPSPINTDKVRIFSNQTPHFHIREFRAFAPNAEYPNPASETADSDIPTLVNYAQSADTKVASSGVYSPDFIYQPKNVIDGLSSSSWVSQTGTGSKWIELTFANDVQIGCIQFTNGWFGSGVWNGLMTDIVVQYWDGTTWRNIYNCNTTITAIQEGDNTYMAVQKSQQLCFNTNDKTISSPITSISPVLSEIKSLKIYPVPTSQDLSIVLEGKIGDNKEGLLTVYDILGKEIVNQKWQNEATSWNVSNLNSGTYYVDIQIDNQVFRGKFIKQ